MLDVTSDINRENRSSTSSFPELEAAAILNFERVPQTKNIAGAG